MARNVIVVGDPTSSGGAVVTGTPFTDIDGHPVARIGDQATCPRHQGTFPIVTGDYTMIIDGHPVARADDKLACGCSLLSARQFRVFLDEGGFGGAAKTVLTTSPVMARAKTPMAPAAFSDAPADPVDQAEQTPVAVTLRIGVFFDGTNNNAANTTLGEQCRASTGDALGQDAEEQAAIAAHCKPYMTRDGSSYDNGVTNVARLYELYADNIDTPLDEGATEFVLRVYVEGIATTEGRPDGLISQGLGTGKSGVVARVEGAFKQLIPRRLEDFVTNFPNALVKAVEFDVFGFSRGAAAARHFVHEVNRKGHGPLGQALLGKVSYASGFEFGEDVQVGFVGLFDSVAAIGSLADGLNVRDTRQGGVRMALPAGSAREVVQLTARDEHRANFLLTSVSPPYCDIALPGVHSDIGGGYHRDREGPLLLSKPAGFDESQVGLFPGQTPDKTRIERSRAHVLAVAEADRWRERLGLGKTDVRVDAWHLWQTRRRAGSPSTQPDRVLRIYAAVVLERALDWRYQLIPLRLMHKLAMEAGVPWEQSPDDVPALSLPADLETVSAKMLSGQLLDDVEESLLRRRYLHQSTHWNFALGQKLGPAPVSLDLVYVSRPDPNGRRGILPNQ